MDRLLKRIQRDRPVAFCCRDFFLLNDYAPRPQSRKCLPIFDPRNVTTFYHPPYSPDLSPPDLKLTKFKGLHFASIAEIQEAATDERKKAPKEEFWQRFRNGTPA